MASASEVAESDIIIETEVGQTSGHTTVTDKGHRSKEPMALHQASPTWLFIVLSAATLPTALSVVMLGPLMVALAHEFQTSVAVAGQLAEATAITWGITASLVGPVSDVYGRRLMLLTGRLLMAGVYWAQSWRGTTGSCWRVASSPASARRWCRRTAL
jgi:hypothetical protein